MPAQSINLPSGVAFAAANLALALGAFGCGGSSREPSNDGSAGSGGGRSGASGSSASGEGGTSRGGMPNGGSSSGGSSSGGSSSGAGAGGEGGDENGGSPGTGGVSAGSGGRAGGGVGGTSPNGGVGGTGQAGAPGGAGQNGGAGQGGSGSGAAGMVGVLGTACSQTGALACAGNHQKLTVLCGGDGKWQANQTCGEGQFCDSTPGPNVGTCRPELPECADGPGTEFCADGEKNLVTCSPDAVSTSSHSCDGACHNGECRDVDECPVWADYYESAACSRDCGVGSLALPCNVSCTGAVRIGMSTGARSLLRTSWADATCPTCDGTKALILVLLTAAPARSVRVTVPEPWHIASTASCGALPRCAVYSASANTLYLISTSRADGPVNVLFEDVEPGTTCPTM